MVEFAGLTVCRRPVRGSGSCPPAGAMPDEVPATELGALTDEPLFAAEIIGSDAVWPGRAGVIVGKLLASCGCSAAVSERPALVLG